MLIPALATTIDVYPKKAFIVNRQPVLGTWVMTNSIWLPWGRASENNTPGVFLSLQPCDWSPELCMS